MVVVSRAPGLGLMDVRKDITDVVERRGLS